MKTFNVICVVKNGMPTVPEGAGYSMLSEPEFVPAYCRVYCYTKEQVDALLNDPVRYPFVAELEPEEKTPATVIVTETGEVALEKIPEGEVLVEVVGGIPVTTKEITADAGRIWNITAYDSAVAACRAQLGPPPPSRPRIRRPSPCLFAGSG